MRPPSAIGSPSVKPLRLVEALTIGDSNQQVEATIARAEYDRLTLLKMDSPS